MPELKPAKKVLISPLDWGLGHASRIVPVIKALMNNNAEVIIAADGAGYTLLNTEFPELRIIRLPFPKIKYSRSKQLIPALIIRFPILLYGIIKEHFQIKKIIKSENIDILISDNRYGLWNKNVKSVFITHQLALKLPAWLNVAGFIIRKVLSRFILKFDVCWIPDFQDNNGLSGELSHKYTSPANTKFIGTLSRFNRVSTTSQSNIRDLIVILSGPEPQRTILEEMLINQIKNTSHKALIVRGLPGSTPIKSDNENISIISFLNSEDLLIEILRSEIVISRSGYSSVMDLFAIKKKAILIPTPGQTEQEYLARHLKNLKMFYTIDQKNFDLTESIKHIDSYDPNKNFETTSSLENEIKKLLPA